MKHGDCWEAICSRCDHASACVWQKDRPEEVPRDCAWCLAAGADASWQHILVRPVSIGRISGFSTSESDFTPHWNASLGRNVRSLAEMKALQMRHGLTDVVVKGDAAERHVPRDIARRVKRYDDIRENPEKYGATFTDATDD